MGKYHAFSRARLCSCVSLRLFAHLIVGLVGAYYPMVSNAYSLSYQEDVAGGGGIIFTDGDSVPRGSTVNFKSGGHPQCTVKGTDIWDFQVRTATGELIWGETINCVIEGTTWKISIKPYYPPDAPSAGLPYKANTVPPLSFGYHFSCNAELGVYTMHFNGANVASFALVSNPISARLRSLGMQPQIPSKISSATQTSLQDYEIFVVDTCGSGSIIPNATVTIANYSVVHFSGGHDHDNSVRPKGEFVPLGSINTGTSGKSVVRYTAPEVAGNVKVTLACKVPDASPCETRDASIEVAVFPRLVPLSEGGYYDLVGSYGTPGVNSQHISNHWATSSFAAKLNKLAEFYFGKYTEKLQYNDISLENGGLFDVFNNWKPDHHEHRIGISGDVRLVPFIRRDELRKMLIKAGIVGKLKIHPDHWHIREYGNNQ